MAKAKAKLQPKKSDDPRPKLTGKVLRGITLALKEQAEAGLQSTLPGMGTKRRPAPERHDLEAARVWSLQMTEWRKRRLQG